MSNNTSYKKIPKELEQKVIVISGTLPGVGKSYVKDSWEKTLIAAGYRVYNDGTTQKASSKMTVAARNHLKNNKDWLCNNIHTRVNGFYFVDEAFMWTEERTMNLVSSYPHMCFILFGDPLQFDPVENGMPLHRCDFGYCLSHQYRSDDEIKQAITSLKDGILPLNFIKAHAKDSISGKELRICYKNKTKDGYNSVTNKKEVGYIYRSSQTVNDSYMYSQAYHNRDFDWKNGQLWKIIEIDDQNRFHMRSLDGCNIITIDEKTLDMYFMLHMAINNHKIQGDSISEVNLWIDMEDLHDELLYKHLYVAISRARRSDQIIFKTSQVADILPTDYKNKKWYKSGLDISTLENTSSDILSKMSAETIINTFIEKVSKKFPVFALYKDEKQKENNNHTDLEKNEYILKCKQYEESTKYGNIEIKRKKAIQKYLREHNGIGFSKKWSDLEKDYAESIREKYWK